MSDFIGAVVSATTGQVYAIVNPTFDSELDNPRFLLIRGAETDALTMVKIPRGDYMGALTLDDVAALVAKLSP